MIEESQTYVRRRVTTSRDLILQKVREVLINSGSYINVVILYYMKIFLSPLIKVDCYS